MPPMVLAPPCDLFMVAGEPSGDAYGAVLLSRLRERMGDLVCAAMGGPALAAAGADMEERSEGLSVMGFLPVLGRLPAFVALGRRLGRVIQARRPRVVLTIDYPGFNLRLLRSLTHLRAAGTRFIHLVAPQVWAWRPRRAKAIARSVDRILCLFPFEPPLFQRFGCQADFVGHLLSDLIPTTISTAAVERELGLGAGERLLLLAPGSRHREVVQLLPVFDRAAARLLPRLATQGPVRAAVATVGEIDRSVYRSFTDLPLVEGRYRELCARAHGALIASGTATLEAAIIGLPHVIAYRTDAVSAAIARHLLITPDIGLPNIVHGHRICPEVMQDELTVPRICAHLERLWSGPVRDRCLLTLAQTRARLGGGGAMAAIADILGEELGRGRRRTAEPVDRGAGPEHGNGQP